MNPNSNMISEFKVSMSNFSAENQKGPAVISSVAKAGGSSFHGSAIHLRENAALNANDWLYNYGRCQAGQQILLSWFHHSAVPC